MAQAFTSIDDYINTFPRETQDILQKIRGIANKVVPGGEETISYGIPTIKLDGKYVVYFSGWKHHIAVYPTPHAAGDELDQALQPYKAGKGTLKFPLDKPVPYDLIERVVVALAADRAERY